MDRGKRYHLSGVRRFAGSSALATISQLAGQQLDDPIQSIEQFRRAPKFATEP